MYYPDGIAVDAGGTIYVTEEWDRVQAFDGNGTHLATLGTHGWMTGSFLRPRGVAVGTAGIVYVADTSNHRVQAFALIRVVPGAGSGPTDTNGDGKYEDVNGNGRKDFADLVLYFNQMTWIEANEPLGCFDYNNNGKIDFADVVWLFNNFDAPPVRTFTVTAVAIGPGTITPSGTIAVREGENVTFTLAISSGVPTPHDTGSGWLVGNLVLLDPTVTPTPFPEPTSGGGGTYTPYNFTPSYTLQDVRSDHTVYGCFYKAGWMIC